MSVDLGFEGAFGYYFSGTGHDLEKDKNNKYKVLNSIHALEIFPIVGTIVGIAAVILFTYGAFQAKNCEERKFLLGEVTRGLVATTSLGCLVLVPIDLIATLIRVRNRRWKDNMYTSV